MVSKERPQGEIIENHRDSMLLRYYMYVTGSHAGRFYSIKYIIIGF